MSKTILKIEPIITIMFLVGLILGCAGGGAGGFFLGKNKTTTNITDVDSRQETTVDQSVTTDVMNGNITIIFQGEVTNKFLNIQIENLTNIQISSTTNELTNYVITNTL